MRHIGNWSLRIMLLAWDILALRISFAWVGTEISSMVLIPWFGGFVFVLFGILAIDGAYSAGASTSRIDETFRIVRAILIATLSLIILTALFQLKLPIGPRGLVKLAIVFALLTIPFRWLLRTLQKYLFKYNIGTRRTILVGSAVRARDIAQEIAAKPELGFEVVGYVGDKADLDMGTIPTLSSDTDTLSSQIKRMRAEDVILTLDHTQHELIPDLITRINGSPVKIQILPDLYEIVAGLGRTENIYGLPLIRVNPEILTPWMGVYKRAADLTIALSLSIVAAPIMLVIAVMVRMSSPGPVIFRQERVGFRGRPFIIHKFRTMNENAEEASGPVWAKKNDPRITSLGRMLRRTRLDELPQLWNILKGDMSLIGPRPERPHFVELLKKEFTYYHRRLLVRPGITGWAQIRGNYDNSLDDVGSKLENDLFYIENMSARLDLKIMLFTFKVMLSGKGQ